MSRELNLNKDFIRALGLDYDSMNQIQLDGIIRTFKRQEDNNKERWRKVFIILSDKAIKGRLTKNTIGTMMLRYPKISRYKYYSLRKEIIANDYINSIKK